MLDDKNEKNKTTYTESNVPTYSEIKLELIEISKIIKTFPENIQSDVYDLLISNYLDGALPVKPIIENAGSSVKKPPMTKKKTGKKKTGKKKTTTVKKQSYTILKDLNLRNGDGQSFKEFVEEKNPSSAIDFNAVAVYFLKETLELEGVTINHINTCYKEVKRKPPGDLLQSIRDTSSNKYGYIDNADSSDIKMPHIGASFVEHDLPKGKK